MVAILSTAGRVERDLAASRRVAPGMVVERGRWGGLVLWVRREDGLARRFELAPASVRGPEVRP